MPHRRGKVKEEFRQKSAKLLDQVREVLRYHDYAIRTDEAYVEWILKFIRFHGTRHPKEMGESEIEAFLSHLAINRHVAVSTQNQAINAILFLHREVLDLRRSEKGQRSGKGQIFAFLCLYQVSSWLVRCASNFLVPGIGHLSKTHTEVCFCNCLAN